MTAEEHPGGPSAADACKLWTTLAAAGPKAIAEALTAQELDRLHVPTKIEDFVTDQVKQGRSVVLTGNAGDGKTMLTARLIAAGARYFSDEVALIERGRSTVRPVPVSLCVKRKGVPLLAPHFADLPCLPLHDREDGQRVRYLPPPAHALLPDGYAARARLVVFRRYVAGVKQRLLPLERAETLARLMDSCVAIPGHIALADAAALVGFGQALHGFELTGSDLDEDAARVLDLCETVGRQDGA